MKKILIIGLIFLSGNLIIGQQNVDYLMKAKALREAGKTDQSITLLDQAIKESKDSRLFLERADANMIKGDFQKAISDLNEANRITPNSGEFGLARIYARKGDASTALYHLGISMSSQYKKSEKEVMLDPAFSNIDNRQEWRQFWKKEWYSISEKEISEIEYYVSAGKIEDSKEVFAALKQNYDTDPDILYAESLINHGSGKYSDVIKVLYPLTQQFPDNEKYLRLLAKAQYKMADAAGASSTYTRLIESDVADAGLFLLRADCYMKTGETDRASKDINKYLEIYPENSDALRLAGRVEAKSGDNIKALKFFSENLKLHPGDPECYIDRANSYFIAKSWDMAINDYSMSLDLKPSDSDAWLNKGIALLNTGKVDDACHDFRISLRYGNKRVADYISRYCIK